MYCVNSSVYNNMVNNDLKNTLHHESLNSKQENLKKI